MALRSRWFCVLSGVVLILGVTAVPGLAQTANKPGASSAAPTPAGSAAPDPEAKKVLDKAKGAYKALKSYQDKANLKFELKARTILGVTKNQDDAWSIDFAYAGPGKFVLSDPDLFRVYGDGTNTTVSLKPRNEYVQAPASEKFDDIGTIGLSGLMRLVHPPAALLTGIGGDEKAPFPMMTEAQQVAAEVRNGKAGKRVTGLGAIPGMEEDGPMPVSMWFNDETGLMEEATFDIRPVYLAMMWDELKVDTAMITVSFTDIIPNGSVEAARYAFKPAEGDKKVVIFTQDPEEDPQQKLVGTLGTDFSGTVLDGKSLKFAFYRDKIVLLTFWATGYESSVRALAKVQQIGEQYADKGVAIIGVSVDGSHEAELAENLLKKHNVTFRQFMDVANALGEAYLVTDIPCFVLLDQDGRIQMIHSGNTAGLKRELAAAIDRLLKGKKVPVVKEAKQDAAPK